MTKDNTGMTTREVAARFHQLAQEEKWFQEAPPDPAAVEVLVHLRAGSLSPAK